MDAGIDTFPVFDKSRFAENNPDDRKLALAELVKLLSIPNEIAFEKITPPEVNRSLSIPYIDEAGIERITELVTPPEIPNRAEPTKSNRDDEL
jgi:hypothetical protein